MPGADGSNHDARQVLFDAVDSGTLPHTVLISGPEGAGKKALAFACADRLLRDPYGRALRGEHPDLVIWDFDEAPDKKQVDFARSLKTEAARTPTEADTRVFVLPHAQRISPPAQNTLLKLLEEPVGYFFLLCENEAAILETVRSRCMKLETQPPSFEQGIGQLRHAFPEANDDALRACLQDAGGYPMQAARLYERSLTPEWQAVSVFADTLLDCAVRGDELGLWSAVMEKDRLSRDDCELLLGLLSEKLLTRIGQQGAVPALLRTAEVVARMKELLPRNVNTAHILGLFPQVFV